MSPYTFLLPFIYSGSGHLALAEISQTKEPPCSQQHCCLPVDPARGEGSLETALLLASCFLGAAAIDFCPSCFWLGQPSFEVLLTALKSPCPGSPSQATVLFALPVLLHFLTLIGSHLPGAPGLLLGRHSIVQLFRTISNCGPLRCLQGLQD